MDFDLVLSSLLSWEKVGLLLIVFGVEIWYKSCSASQVVVEGVDVRKL